MLEAESKLESTEIGKIKLKFQLEMADKNDEQRNAGNLSG